MRPERATRMRILAGVAGIVTIATGVAVRHWLPSGFWSKYSGVALWALVLYALVVFVRPGASVSRCALVALLISWAVEFAQITPVPGWLSSKHPLLRMVFGEFFSFKDLPAYAVGVLLGAVMHLSIARQSGRMRSNISEGPQP